MVSRWWRCLTQRTPAGETLRPRFTHLVRHPTLPPRRLVDRQADTRLFDLGANLFLRISFERLISINTASPPVSQRSLNR